MENVEIERKFLLSGAPKIIENMARPHEVVHKVEQGYISLDPEVRLRCDYKLFTEPKYIMTVKSDGTLARKEIEIYLTEDQYTELRKAIPYPMIKKLFYILEDKDTGYNIQVSFVDDMSFIYAEVEFDTVEAAKSYKLPEWFTDGITITEVTEDKSYKMKNYWKRTRLNINK
jgi:CYTH domain-containing protein